MAATTLVNYELSGMDSCGSLKTQAFTYRHDTVVRDICMVRQGVQTRTRSTLVTFLKVWRLEGMVPCDFISIILQPQSYIVRMGKTYYQLESS